MYSDKYVGPPYCRTEMYAGRVACCPLVIHGEYADQTDRQTYGRRTVTLRFPTDKASVLTIYARQSLVIK